VAEPRPGRHQRVPRHLRVCEDARDGGDDPGLAAGILREFIDTASALLYGDTGLPLSRGGLRRFVATIASMKYGGEGAADDPDGEGYVMECDDARDTLARLITEAGELLNPKPTITP
jgi:hypothetical protein